MADITDIDDRSDFENLSTGDKDTVRGRVRNLSSTGFQQMSDDKLDEAIINAVTEASTLYTGRFARMPTLDGDAGVFRRNLAAHKAELAEGGEAQSESNAGGNISYNTVTGDAISDLQQTRFGRTALKHVRDRQGLGLERSRF